MCTLNEEEVKRAAKKADLQLSVTVSDVDGRENGEMIWNKVKEVILQSRKEIELQKRKPRKKKQIWISDRTLDLIEERQDIKRKGLITSAEYRNLNRLIQKSCREDRKAFIEESCREMQEHAKTNNLKSLYKKIKQLTRDFKP